MELRLKSGGKWQKKLVEMPESGMGYQIVDIALKDGRIARKVVVVNAAIAYLPVEYGNVCENDIAEIQMSN